MSICSFFPILLFILCNGEHTSVFKSYTIPNMSCRIHTFGRVYEPFGLIRDYNRLKGMFARVINTATRTQKSMNKSGPIIIIEDDEDDRSMLAEVFREL